MLDDNQQNGGSTSSESSSPPPTPTRDTSDVQIRTENGGSTINKDK